MLFTSCRSFVLMLFSKWAGRPAFFIFLAEKLFSRLRKSFRLGSHGFSSDQWQRDLGKRPPNRPGLPCRSITAFSRPASPRIYSGSPISPTSFCRMASACTKLQSDSPVQIFPFHQYQTWLIGWRSAGKGCKCYKN